MTFDQLEPDYVADLADAKPTRSSEAVAVAKQLLLHRDRRSIAMQALFRDVLSSVGHAGVRAREPVVRFLPRQRRSAHARPDNACPQGSRPVRFVGGRSAAKMPHDARSHHARSKAGPGRWLATNGNYGMDSARATTADLLVICGPARRSIRAENISQTAFGRAALGTNSWALSRSLAR